MINDPSVQLRAPAAGRRTALLLSTVLLAALGTQASGEDGLRVLFLGDKGHHEPAKRFGWISPALEKAGIRATYTEKTEDLSPSTLAAYDALILYANIRTVTAEQEKALIDYVEQGHGFVPLHCASYCFGGTKEVPEAKALTALTGGRFKSHKTAVFTPVIALADHPVMLGFANYTAWDETYVHHSHNEEGRTVLAYRVDGEVKEPWTWVRQQGKGRVFYTASGHDERVWKLPAYQELVIRGTAWAAGEKGQAILAHAQANPVAADPVAAPAPVAASPAVKPFLIPKRGVPEADEVPPPPPRSDPRPPLQYEPRPTVQNYEKRSPYPQYQLPLSAKDSQAYTTTEAGFSLEFFAGEPDVVKPIAFTWDHRGRLFVLQSTDYPSTFTEQWKGGDKIILCEDTKGTGRADKFTVWADGLNIATGLTFVNGGLLVSQAPNLLFLKDTDGDDKADVKEIVSTGWSKRDTHAGPSNLRYGFDNQVYGSVGYSGFAGEFGGKKSDFRQGIWRMTRGFDAIEFLGQYTNNTWGLGFNEEGELFGSTANNAHHFYTPIPIPYALGIKALEKDKRVVGSFKMDAHYDAHPLTKKIRQVDVLGGFSAVAGHAIYTARNFPQKYWNRAALVNEPTMHLLHQGFLKRDGSGWIEDGDGRNLVASEDEWFAPVHSEVGPDGAVWVADWYNFIIQHNPTPKVANGGFDAKTGDGGAHVNPLRDHERGRIYRVVWKDAKPSAIRSLDPKDPAQLVKALAADNLFWRQTAQRLLVERNQKDVVPALIALAKDQGVDQLGINGGVIHALWTLHGLKALDGSDPAALAAAVAALRHPALSVRRNAVQVLPATAASARAILDAGLLTDPEPNVQLAALLAVSVMPGDDAIAGALVKLSRDPRIASDRWLPNALRIAAARNAGRFLAAELAAGIAINAGDKGAGDLERTVARHAVILLSQDEQTALMARLVGADPVLAGAILDGLSVGWIEHEPAKDVTPAQRAVFVTLATKLDEANQRRVGAIAERWGIRAGLPGIAGVAVAAAPAAPTAKPLTPEQQKRFDAGKTTYLTLCIACHQPDGQGLAAVAPPLAASEWVNGSDDILIRMVLHGVKGPITAAGKTFNLEMPAFKDALDDNNLADLLTYIRREWGNNAPPVDAGKVKGIRRGQERDTPWTVPELQAIK